jgi:hypothetical protein
MSSSGRNEKVLGFLYCYGELGSGWSRVDAIGRAGRCSGAVLCAEFSGVGVAIGGETVRSGWSRVKFGRV